MYTLVYRKRRTSAYIVKKSPYHVPLIFNMKKQY